MQRRHFLYLSTAAVASLLSRCAAASPTPTVIRSQAGRLNTTLIASENTLAVGSRPATLLAYNGQVPGPRLEVQAGDIVDIRLINQLRQSTNLHFHGLHVPPTGSADNVFVHVPPGESFTYRFTIPRDHPAGLFWYHPHHHGTVAEQVFGGLAGALVVRGAFDDIVEIAAADEAILVLQDFDLDRWGRRRAPMPMFRRWGRQGDTIAINGQSPPEIVMSQGLLRLRLLNASASRYYRLRLTQLPWHLAALDGHSLEAPVETPEVLLTPGQRAELLIVSNGQPGRCRLESLPYDRGFNQMMGGRGMAGPHRGMVGSKTPIAQILCQAPQVGALPAQLIAKELLAPPSRQRELVLDHGLGAQPGQAFLINGQGFDADRVDIRAALNTVEDWRIINRAGMDHPFHLHTNAFQVTHQNDQRLETPLWRDVVNVKAYESVTIRVPFRDYAGRSVYHCHILDHEDQGMMGIVGIDT